MSLDEEVKYRTPVETAPDAIFLAETTTGQLLEANERAVTLLGYDRAALLGKSVEDIHSADTDRYTPKFAEAVRREPI